MRKPFKLTAKQKELLVQLRDRPWVMYCACIGGSRSGKTFMIIHMIVVRALKYPETRHLICRLRLSHAKASLYHETMPAVLAAMGLREGVHYKVNRTDYIYTFFNGSEIQIDGLDNAERVDKLLGREYFTIYINESSQVPYDTVTTILSRLAQIGYTDDGIEGKAMVFVDLNPGTKRHWTYQLFILGKDPVKRLELAEDQKKRYFWFHMNPQDNLENLNRNYIEMLENLPDAKKKRFLLGEYADVEGQIFQEYTPIPYIPAEIKQIGVRSLGIDFGFTVDPAVCVELYYIKKRYGKSQLYIHELVYDTGLTNKRLGSAILDAMRRRWDSEVLARYSETDKTEAYDLFHEREYARVCGIEQCMSGMLYAYADSAEPKSITELNEFFTSKTPQIEVLPGSKGRDSIKAGIDWLQDLEVFITTASVHVMEEWDSYEWEKDNEGRPLPTPKPGDEHTIDAIRYGGSLYIGNATAHILQIGAQ